MVGRTEDSGRKQSVVRAKDSKASSCSRLRVSNL